MPSLIQEIQEAIQSVETGAFLSPRFPKRAAAMEFLEIHVLDRLRILEERGGLPVDLQPLWEQAMSLYRCLEAADKRYLGKLSRRIKAGLYTPPGLKRAFTRLVGPPESRGAYDALDSLVAGLLGDGVPPMERAKLEPEMVAYQPTPAREILKLIEKAALSFNDVFYDLGSGLGRVVLLTALLSGAKAKGIEFEPAYCDYARRSAERLHLAGVEFIQADAREAPFSDGTVFFLYTPFRGAMLKQVLERLKGVAKQHPIRVCTYGPCTPEVAAASWLRSREARLPVEQEVAVFQSI